MADGTLSLGLRSWTVVVISQQNFTLLDKLAVGYKSTLLKSVTVLSPHWQTPGQDYIIINARRDAIMKAKSKKNIHFKSKHLHSWCECCKSDEAVWVQNFRVYAPLHFAATRSPARNSCVAVLLLPSLPLFSHLFLLPLLWICESHCLWRACYSSCIVSSSD